MRGAVIHYRLGFCCYLVRILPRIVSIGDGAFSGYTNSLWEVKMIVSNTSKDLHYEAYLYVQAYNKINA
ncbi:MAG: hypothetical protein IPM85_11685 [Chitinophagaceae bacterium]|nr:hypothetical protein [Chitinophagaceae bacterium]